MWRLLIALLFWASTAVAQVTVDPQKAVIKDGWWTLEVELGLGTITPYRAFILDAPRRLVVDFEGVSFNGLDPAQVLSGDRAKAVRFGPLRPGWSRMVVDLAEPLVIETASLHADDDGALLQIVLSKATEEEFAVRAGAPPDPGWEAALAFDPLVADRLAQSEDFIVVLDAGHGGIDPGANRAGIKEADLMLILAEEMAVILNEVEGVQAVLTRKTDSFVPLSSRLTIARQVGADLLISLHADALDEDAAQGASVYTLSENGGGAATQRHVERHERGDLLAGVDLGAAEDRVATALMDLARAQTAPEGRRFADALVGALARQDVRLNSRPRREGQFAVLTAADFPSVLLEAGFLSNPQDRAYLATPEGRAAIAHAVRETVILMAR